MPAEKVTRRQWFAVMGAMIGAFMAVLDIQITNSSLNDIAGALGCSLDEGSWISTSYLVAEIIVIGTSAWLAQVFSIKRYLLFSVITFVFFSLMCAFSTNLDEMIIGRALQGLTGGALIPLAFTINILILPPSVRPIGNAIFAMTATFAPAIGPTIGGWLTDNYGWQWIFFINIVPGTLMLYLLSKYLDCDGTMRLELLKDGDYFGIVSMALGLGSLEYVLEEGERNDWFGSPAIRDFAIVAGIFITLFIWRELTAKKPFVNLRVLKHLPFTLCTLILTALGLALYGSVYLIPVYLAQIQGYSPLQIGETLMWVGLPQLVLLPFVPKLMKLVDPRIVAAAGPRALRLQLHHQRLSRPGLWHGPVPLLEHHPRAGPAADFRAAAEHVDPGHSAERGGLGVSGVQHGPQHRRLGRHCHALDYRDAARAFALGASRRVRDGLLAGGGGPDQPVSAAF